MQVVRLRLAAPLSSLGVIVASMGQPNADVPREAARGARFSIQTGGRGKALRRHPRTLYDATREVAERLEAFGLPGSRGSESSSGSTSSPRAGRKARSESQRASVRKASESRRGNPGFKGPPRTERES